MVAPNDIIVSTDSNLLHHYLTNGAVAQLL